MDWLIDWLKRPQLLAALALVVLGIGLLAAGPLLRSQAVGATEVIPVEEVDVPLAEEVPFDGDPLPTATPAAVVVYISGAVAAPDVYVLPRDARVKDAVAAAGGLSGEADTAKINLAAHLSDEQHIHIPTRNEATAGDGADSASGLLNINTADTKALEELPGIGASLAERIVSYRDEQGPFASVDALGDVPGIGASLLEKIRPLVTVGG